MGRRGCACHPRFGEPRWRPGWASWLGSLLLTASLGQALPARAEEPRLRFGRLAAEEGLSSNWVLALARDHRGFLWIGTQDGLYRYDGNRAVAYRHVPSDPHSLPSPVAGVLFEDSRGRLWVGSRWGSQGMALYDRGRDRFQRLPLAGSPDGGQGPAARTGLADARVNALAEGPAGRLWVATAKGVDLVDHERQLFEHYPMAPAADGQAPRLATALLSGRHGTLWVGTTEGLFRLDPTARRCVPWRGFESAGATPLDGQRIEAMVEDGLGHLWIGTVTAGLFELDPGAQAIRQYLPRPDDDASLSHVRVRALALDGAGTLWVGTENGGLDALDRATGRFRRFLPDPFVPGSLGSASIYALLSDRQGLLWIGTYDSGVNYYSPLEQRFGLVTASPAGLRDPRVTAFLEDRDGVLWIGTDGGGLCRAAASLDAITCLNGPGDDSATVGPSSVLTLAQARDGMVWMGGWGAGLARLDPERGTLTRFRHRPHDPSALRSNDVWAIRELRSGELAVATHQGTDLVEMRTGRATRLSQRYPGALDAMTLALCETRVGDLWLGQNGRVQHIHAETGKVTVYAQDQAGPLRLAGGQVFAILEDSQGNVWIGGEGGLAYLPAGQAVGSALVAKTGLPHPVVTSLLEDESGDLWVTTHRGLTRLAGAAQDPAALKATHFDAHDGLQDNEFSRGAALRLRDGRLLFGGRRGLNAFDPAKVPTNKAGPEVVLTELRVLGRPVRPGEPGSPLERTITETVSLSVSQDLAVLTFELAALNLVLPQKNRYAYMLDGLDTEWRDAGAHRDATYTQLRHGDYVFRARAANNDGVWNEAGLALRLHVEPRWHERPGVRVVAIGLGVLLGVGLLGWRARRFRARERELTKRVEQRTRELHQLNEELEGRVWRRTAEVEQEKQRLSATLASIADAVLATDTDGRVVLMNRVAERLTGWSATAAVGRPIAKVLPRLDPVTREPRSAPDAAVFESDEPIPARESLLPRVDGTELLVVESAAPIRDHGGHTLGVVLAFRDITRQRKLEEQLASNQKLEALGMLAGGIAHDFNNLLTGVLGYLDLARLQSSGGKDGSEPLGKALSLLQKGRGLTSQVLAFARGAPAALAPVRLAELLAKSADLALAGSKVTCALELAPDLWPCLGDQGQLEQVFDNLLINARQAMPGGGAVTVAAHNVALDMTSTVPLPQGRYVRVSVADHGPGIPKDVQGRIFDPFFTTKAEGTGLGLATTHAIVRKHRGHIEVSSEAGHGARFTLYLPAG